MDARVDACIGAYKNRETVFKYRGRRYDFSLSLELFSSAGVDTGTSFLLKVFSNFLDALPGGALGGGSYSVLDAGSGAGVLGICAAGALKAIVGTATGGPAIVGPAPFRVRAQDRDELARIFTEYNARRNGIREEELSARAEPLLAGPPGGRWDLILTNIPAKAGLPVLEDFVGRSAGLLKEGGRVFLVAVNTLAGFFRSRIAAAGAVLFACETGKEHTVFVYGAGCAANSRTLDFDENFPLGYPFYLRGRSDCRMEGVSYHLDAVYGAPDFDEPGGAVQAAAKLALKIELPSQLAKSARPNETGAAILVHDAGQGHFSLWLAHCLKGDAKKCGWVLSGRNILALAAARTALGAALRGPDDPGPVPAPRIAPSTDILPDPRLFPAACGVPENSEHGEPAKSPGGFALAAFFPETAPDVCAAWEGLAGLAAPEGIVIIGMDSSNAERFDRRKPQVFTRLGDIKRKGFRALAYRKNR